MNFACYINKGTHCEYDWMPSAISHVLLSFQYAIHHKWNWISPSFCCKAKANIFRTKWELKNEKKNYFISYAVLRYFYLNFRCPLFMSFDSSCFYRWTSISSASNMSFNGSTPSSSSLSPAASLHSFIALTEEHNNQKWNKIKNKRNNSFHFGP